MGRAQPGDDVRKGVVLRPPIDQKADLHEPAAGTASGLGGFLQMGTAAVAAQVVGSIQDGTPYPMAIGMTFCAAAALTAALVALRYGRARRQGHRPGEP